MDIIDVLRTIENVSTLLVFPIFEPENVKYNNYVAESNYAFLQLFYNNGGKKTYLNVDDMELTVVMDLKKGTKSLYPAAEVSDFSLLDVLGTHPATIDIQAKEDELILIMQIPEHFHEDVQEISRSKYTKVSQEYLQALKSKATLVPSFGADVVLNISEYDLGYHICKGSEGLKEMLEDSLGVRVEDGAELFKKFDIKNETYE